ncbi:hypothetical protein V5O48_016462, partial [Marasmius crinis-equi]
SAARAACISIASNVPGAPVVVHDCNEEDSSMHNWDFTRFTSQNAPPQALKIFRDKCLDVPDGKNADGTKLQIWTCENGNRNQLWISATDFTFQWAGTNKCIDLTDGAINDGNQIQIWTCDSNNSNQKWTASSVVTQPQPPGVQLLASGGAPHSASQCLTAANDTDGGRVSLATCVDMEVTFPAGNMTWVIPPAGTAGQIKTFDGAKCLDLGGGGSANGNSLRTWTCEDGNGNQMWNVDGSDDSSSRLISWASQRKCVDVKDGSYKAGND